MADKARQAAAIRGGKQHAPGSGGALNGILSFLGVPGFKSQAQQDQEYVQTLEPSATASGADEIAAAARDYAKYGQLGDSDLLDVIDESQPDASDEEKRALFHAIRGMR